ncbi:MAG: hypothetical protein KDD25_09970, partial [Bdellovibrionales bacterium]|nr:hypothetical protein [Bdellovibrionales bacterium]
LIKQAVLNLGDKISINDLIFEYAQEAMNLPTAVGLAVNSAPAPWSPKEVPPQMGDEPPRLQKNFFSNIRAYIESVALPGFYRMAEVAEFRFLLGIFVLVFVLLVTTLSVIPMAQISRERIEAESQARAFDIATSLANRYRSALNMGLGATFTIQEERTEGVEVALVVDANDGHILAPARKVGQFADVPFVNVARKITRENVSQLDDSSVGASVPIKSINPDTGEASIRAYSIVIYDMGSRALRSSDVIRLFVQVLALALLIGFVLYFIMYKVIEYPLVELNQKLDASLKDSHEEILIKYNYPVFQRLVTYVNSALSRMDQSGGSVIPIVDPVSEAKNLCDAFTQPCMVAGPDQRVYAINLSCEDLIGANGGILNGRSIGDVPDEALKLNLEDIWQKAVANQMTIHRSQIEFLGVPYSIQASTVNDADGVKYVVFTFNNESGGF